MSNARLIKRKDVEQGEKQDRPELSNVESPPLSFETIINWRSKWQTARATDPRAAFTALFNNHSPNNAQN